MKGKKMWDNWVSNDEAKSLVQIAGLIRFSCPFEKPGAGGFRWRFKTVEAQLEAMYAKDRMEERFTYFEKICLHSLKHQTDQDFTFGVLVGKDMPAVYRKKLEDLLSGFPQAKIISLPILPYKRAIRQAFNRLFDRDTPFRLSFRLDDDDAVAVDFIEQVSEKIPQLLALSGAIDPVALSFLRRATLFGGHDNRRLVISVDSHPNSAGFCVLASKDRSEHAYTYVHTKAQMSMPTLMDCRTTMSLRTFHSSNDSDAIVPRASIFSKSEAEIQRQLRDRFCLDTDEVLGL